MEEAGTVIQQTLKEWTIDNGQLTIRDDRTNNCQLSTVNCQLSIEKSKDRHPHPRSLDLRLSLRLPYHRRPGGEDFEQVDGLLLQMQTTNRKIL